MAALSNQFALFQYKNMISSHNLCKSMRDQQRCPSSKNPAHSPLDLVFGITIDGARRVIDNQDAWVSQESSGNGNSLTLAARKVHTALADNRLVAIGKIHNELMGLRHPGRILDLRLGCCAT